MLSEHGVNSFKGMIEELAERYVIPREGNNRSAYGFLQGKLSQFPSRKSLKKGFAKQLVLRNQNVLTWDAILKTGDEISVKRATTDIKPYLFKLNVVYEDDWLAVIWKPAGIPVSGNVFKSIRNMLPYNLNPSTAIDALPQPEPVHRLDKPTSGWLIAAKTFSVANSLGKMFSAQRISKTYLALVHGYFNGSAELTANAEGKVACSKIRTLKIVKDKFGRVATLLEVQPLTGRKHQIRVHLSGLGLPIFGDKQYQKKRSTVKDKGLFLCASGLSFFHPKTNEKLDFQAPIPNKFVHKLKGKIILTEHEN